MYSVMPRIEGKKKCNREMNLITIFESTHFTTFLPSGVMIYANKLGSSFKIQVFLARRRCTKL